MELDEDDDDNLVGVGGVKEDLRFALVNDLREDLFTNDDDDDDADDVA
jgi:hypothetical protein